MVAIGAGGGCRGRVGRDVTDLDHTRAEQVSGIRTVAVGANALRTQALHEPEECSAEDFAWKRSKSNSLNSLRGNHLESVEKIGWVLGTIFDPG
jgi:hypothetical protein